VHFIIITQGLEFMGLIFVPKKSVVEITHKHLFDILLNFCKITPYNEDEMTGHI
jgi:hypothetical protein